MGLLFTCKGVMVAFTYVKNAEEKDAQDTLKLFKEHKTDGVVGDPIAIPCDLGFDDECKKVIDAVAKTFGRIDILVNNAAEQHVVESIEIPCQSKWSEHSAPTSSHNSSSSGTTPLIETSLPPLVRIRISIH